MVVEENQSSVAMGSCSECSSPQTQRRQQQRHGQQVNSSIGDSSLTEGAEMTDHSSSSSERGNCTDVCKDTRIRDDDDDEEKDPQSREVRKLLRVMANRRSARESRDRRKKLVADLQGKVAALAESNAKITESNLAMRRELASLLQEAGF